jgi:ABC-type nickel/cobalt efflux system permease component RcnA
MRRRVVAVVVAALAVPAAAVITAGPASAHPLGNLSVNTYDGVVVAVDGVRVDHVEDIAEIPTVAALQEADLDHDGAASTSELSAWAGRRCVAAAGRVALAVGGRTLRLTVASSSAVTAPGQAGLRTMRVECDLRAAVQVSGRTDVVAVVTPPNDLGWREVTLVGDGTTVVSSDVPTQTVSDRLSAYPGDLTASPDRTSAHAAVVPGGPRLGAITSDGPVARAARGVDQLTVAVEDLAGRAGPVALVLLVLGGLVLGAMHALAPGHGKTVVAMAALAGRGTGRRDLLRSAATLGLSITAAHTGSVVLVGTALTLLGAVVPAALFPALAVLGGVLVVVIGAGILRGRYATHTHGPGGHTHGPDDHSHGPDGHTHGATHDDHGHDGHGHDGHAHDGHAHGLEHGHDAVLVAEHARGHLGQPVPSVTRAPAEGLVMTRTSSTAVLVPTAAPVHDHAHGHDHDHAPDHDHGPDHTHDALDHRGYAHDHHRAHDEVAAPVVLRRRSLVALGVVGGLTPSPTALVVLLGTMAVGRTWVGLVAVAAFGVGMALTLVTAGLLAVLLGSRVARLARARGVSTRWFSLAPRIAGLAVVGAGLVLVARGVLDLVVH